MRKVLNCLGRGSFQRGQIAGALGYKSGNGGIGARKVAALTQFGLLERASGRYSTTPLSLQIVRPKDSAEKDRGLRQALGLPPLFKAILDRYEPEGRIPEQLANILCRDHGIATKASSQAAEVFLESAVYAGVLNALGGFVARMDDEPALQEGQTRSRASSDSSSMAAWESGQRFEFALTRGKLARLVLPMSLTRADVELVRKQVELQIEFLEFQLEGDEE